MHYSLVWTWTHSEHEVREVRTSVAVFSAHPRPFAVWRLSHWSFARSQISSNSMVTTFFQVRILVFRIMAVNSLVIHALYWNTRRLAIPSTRCIRKLLQFDRLFFSRLTFAVTCRKKNKVSFTEYIRWISSFLFPLSFAMHAHASWGRPNS